MKPTLGAYYQCYKKRTCVNFVLENFRKFYPDSSVFLICDGGKDFTEESKKYNCVYEYVERAYTQNVNLFEDVNSMKEHMFRFGNIDKISENYFMILEDDVYIKKEVNIGNLKYDINGCNKNEFFKYAISSLIKEQNSNFSNIENIYYGAFGGCILNTEFFKKIFENKKKLESDLELFYKNATKDEVAADIILSYLCLINGGTIGSYNGLCEIWYKDYKEREQTNNIEVLHHYKDLYNCD